MATKLNIVNFALSHLGHVPVSTLSDSSPVSLQGNLWIDQARKELLIAYPWVFATKRKRLIEKTLTEFEKQQFLGEWLYVYHYPDDCLFMQYIVEPSRASQAYQVTDTPFTVENNPSDLPGENDQIILANETKAVAVYTRDIVDFEQLPPHFVQPLSILLASYLAYPLTTDVNLKASMLQMFNTTLITYTSQDANQLRNKLPQESEIIQARTAEYSGYYGEQ